MKSLVSQVVGGHGRTLPSAERAARLQANAANAAVHGRRNVQEALGTMEARNPSPGMMEPAVQASLGRMEQGGGAPTVQQLINNPGIPTHSRPAPAAAGGGGKPPTNSPAAEVAAAGGGAESNLSYLGMQNGLFAGFNDSVQGGFGHVLAGGMIGGIGSYATGGEFGQGFAMGTVGGFGVRQLHRSLGSNSAMWQSRAERFAASDRMGSKRMAGLLDNVNAQGSAHSLHTMNQRKAMYMGAGLMGVMGGGDRNSHRRGFNSHRGNTF